MKKIKTENIIYTVIYCVLAVLLINRITYTVIHYDEVFNLYVSFITGLGGKQHLVDNTYIFQMGDLFNLPFVYLFTRLKGNTAGIVLFLRFIYFLFNVLVSFVFYKCFKDSIGKRNSILFSLIFLIYSPFEMYSVYYDTAALLFLLMGAFLLIKAESAENPFVYRLLAAVCHAFMAYAYPLMVLIPVILCIIIFVFEKGKRFKNLLPYICGLVSVFLVFVLYVLIFCGPENLFIFKEGVLDSSIGDRGIGEIAEKTVSTGGFDWHNIKALVKLRDILFETRSSLYELIPFFFIMLVQWALSLKWLKKLRWLMIPEVIIAGLINYRSQGGGFVFTRLFAHYFCYAPLFYFFLEDKKHREIGKRILMYLWIPGLIAFMAVGYTAWFANKAIMGLMPGGIATVIFMVFIIRECAGARVFDKAFILLLSSCHLLMFYINYYEDVSYFDSDYKISSGIFRGLHGTEEDKFSEDLFEYLESFDGEKTYYSNVKQMRYIVGLSDIFSDYEYDMSSVFDRLSEKKSADEKRKVLDGEALPGILVLENEKTETQLMERDLGVVLEKYELSFEEYGYKVYRKSR